MSHLPALSASKNADVASSTATLKHMKLGRSYPRRWLLFLFLGFLSGDLRQLVSLQPSCTSPPQTSQTLEAQMLSLASQNAPNKKVYQKKQAALKTVTAVFRQQFRKVRLSVIPFGSSVTGLCEGSSDVDIVLFFPGACPTPHKALGQLRRKFTSRRGVKVCEALLMKRMKRPLLRLDIQGVRCDLTCQNALPLFNTALLRSYVDLLPEIPVPGFWSTILFTFLGTGSLKEPL